MREHADIPRFFLYGEPPREAGERFVHVETIAERSRVNDWRIRPHAHRDLHQLLVIFAGGGEMQAETQRRPFRAPAVLILPAGVVHGFAFETDTQGYVVTLADMLLRDLARNERRFRSLFAAATCASIESDPAHFQDLAQTLPKLKRELAWNAPASAVAAAARLTTLLVSVVRALHQPAELTSPAGNTRAALVARLRETIEIHLRGGLSVSQYAEALNVTPARLRAACLEVTGKPPARVLEERLLLEAKRDLTYTNMTVAQIAYDLGFTDPAYFSRFFSKLAGESPAAFRKRLAG
ncbi:MAG: helix-turn-helix domain-containing protein [Steroidobacteraceae bacterium]